MTRKRVRANAIPRASDGSAFLKCDMCGNSVAIALADMHECQSSQEMKRFKGIIQTSQCTKEDRFLDQPRSPFCFFMEEFKLKSTSVDPIEIDRQGFRTWKNMSEEERKPYVIEAARVNFIYDKALRQEQANRFRKPDVEVEGRGTKSSDLALASWENFSDSEWRYVPDLEGIKTSNLALDSWVNYSDSEWRAYVPEEEKATTAKKSSSGCTYREDNND